MEKSKNNQPKTKKTVISESRNIAKPPTYKIATPPPKPPKKK